MYVQYVCMFDVLERFYLPVCTVIPEREANRVEQLSRFGANYRKPGGPKHFCNSGTPIMAIPGITGKD